MGFRSVRLSRKRRPSPRGVMPDVVVPHLEINIERMYRALMRVAAAALVISACAKAPPATTGTGERSISTHSQKVLPLTSGDAAAGRKAFVALQCHACHRVAGDDTLPVVEDAWDGPVLHDLGTESEEEVAWKIVTRSGTGPESVFESPMVEHASAMTERQLVDLIAYLRNPVQPQP